MGRPPTDPDKKMIGFTVKLTPQQHAFLEEQKELLDVSFGADVIREIVEGLRTWFALPAYQAEILQKEMASKKHTWPTYLREVLARRYELLRQSPPPSPPKSRGRQ